MGRKNSPSAKKELTEIIQRYEAAKAEKQTEAKKALCNCLFLGYTVLERFDRIFYSGLTCDPENLWITIMRKTDNDIRRIT